MSKGYKPSALRRAAEELKTEPGTRVAKELASFCDGGIALDFGARLLYCSELSVIEVISPFATKEEVKEKINDLINRLETKRVAQAETSIKMKNPPQAIRETHEAEIVAVKKNR